MIKKAFLTAVAILVAISLTGCAIFDTLTAYGLYSRAVSKIEKAGGFNVDCVVAMSFNVLGEDITMDMSINVKTNQDSAQYSVDMAGESVTSTYIDDKIYVEYGDYLIFYTSTDTDLMEELFGDYDIPSVTKDTLEGVEVVRNDDGTKEIVFSFDDESMQEIFGTIVSDLDNVTVEDVVYTMVFDKKNNLSAMTVDCNLSYDILGYTMTGKMNMEYTFIDFGTAPEITLAHDESEYEDGGEYQG